MDNHDGAVFPHYAYHKPQHNSDEEKIYIPWRVIEPRQAISNQLDDGRNPLNNINFFHMLSPRAKGTEFRQKKSRKREPPAFKLED